MNYMESYLNNVPSNIKIIVTSRDNSIDMFSNEQRVNLLPFNYEQTLYYFKQAFSENIENNIIQESDIKKLITMLDEQKNGILPYRLNKVIEWFEKEQFGTIEEYIETYKQGGDDQPETNLLLDILLKSGGSNNIHMLQYASYLDPDFISGEILISIFGNKDLVEESIGNLLKLSLIEMDESHEKDGIRIHRLTQDGLKKYVERHKLDEQAEKTLSEDEILNNLVAVLEDMMPEVKANPQDDIWLRATNLSKHVEKILDEISNSELEIKSTSFTKLLNKMWAYNQYVANDYDKALEYQKEFLSILKNSPQEEDHAAELTTAYSNIGVTYESLVFYPEALENHLLALNIRGEKLGENHPDFTTSLKNVIETYKILGNQEKYLEYQEQLLGLSIESNDLSIEPNEELEVAGAVEEDASL